MTKEKYYVVNEKTLYDLGCMVKEYFNKDESYFNVFTSLRGNNYE